MEESRRSSILPHRIACSGVFTSDLMVVLDKRLRAISSENYTIVLT